MKILTLDYATWRSGEDGAYSIGEGMTSLLNSRGFMCCLGQWCLQLGADKTDIVSRGEPGEVQKVIEGLNIFEKMNDDDEEATQYSNTSFSTQAMSINDETETTAEEKIELLTALCKEHGFELRVINKP